MKITRKTVFLILFCLFITEIKAQEEIWGLMNKGGEDGIGTVIRINNDGSDFEKIYDFDLSAEGSFPRGRFLKADNGLFYGVTEQGGEKGFGQINQYNATDRTYRKVLDFDSALLGKAPQGGLVQADNGLFTWAIHGNSMKSVSLTVRENYLAASEM